MTFSFMVLEPTIKLSWSDVHPGLSEDVHEVFVLFGCHFIFPF
jgi:hypothetical protein